jgi:hypothetical protein
VASGSTFFERVTVKVGSNFPWTFLHIHSVNLDIIKVFYSPTDAQVNCLKNNFKIYNKIDIKTAPTCFGAINIIRERIIRAAATPLN